LYSFALQEIKTQTGKFFIWLQTISFHKVYDTPYWNTQESALKYADESLYNFYKWLEDINFFDSWILIIVWDHRKMNPAEKWELELFGENRYTRTIATVVWSWINKNTINNNIIQHTDIYDSIKKLIWNWKITINKFHNNIFTWKANRERWITSSPYYANKYTITLTWNKSFTFNNLSNLKLNNQEIYDFFSSYIKFELTNSSNDEWKEETILIWHKWAPKDAPENSIESFLTAKNQGAQWIELDISYTNDKKNIVAHWEYLYATNCNNKKIWNYTLDRINENCKYKNWESIKTLQETLEILDWLFDYYFIEIKVYESNAKEQTLDAIETIRSLNMQKKVILISYNDTARYILWAQTDIISWRDTYDTWDIELLKNSNYKYIWLPYESFSKEIANEISKQWKIPFTYTINNTWDFKKIKDMWINIIMTNNIPLLKNFNE
jgi:glycerophosphoryl diester phosphodiesterase